jgi:hypothetical protein
VVALTEAQTPMPFTPTECSLGLCSEVVQQIGLLICVKHCFFSPLAYAAVPHLCLKVIAGYEPQPPSEVVRLPGNPARRSSHLGRQK